MLLLAVVGPASGCSDTANGDLDAAETTDTAPSDALAFRGGDSPQIRIVEPADGAIVTSPFELVVEVDNYELVPAGTTQDGEGHFHLIVDRDCLGAGEWIPTDAIHLHFGGGQDRGEVELAPGRHQLCAQMSDGFHVAVDIVDSIEVVVEGDAGAADGEVVDNVDSPAEAAGAEGAEAAEGVAEGDGAEGAEAAEGVAERDGAEGAEAAEGVAERDGAEGAEAATP